MSTMLKQETIEVRDTLAAEARKMELGIAVENNVMAIFDRKVSFAYDAEDIAEAYKIARRNLYTFSGIQGHSFGAQ